MVKGMIVKGMEPKRPFMIIHLTIIPLTLPAYSLPQHPAVLVAAGRVVIFCG